MKKVFFVFIILMAFFSSKAQYGIKFGLNAANAHYKAIFTGTTSTNIDKNADLIFLPSFGGFFSFSLGSSVFFRPEILLSGFGFKRKDTGYERKLWCIDIPLNFIYKMKAGNNSFFTGIGPDIAIAVAVKVKDGAIDGTDKIGNIYTDDDNRRWLFGGNILAGYELENGFTIAANYNLGLNNIEPAEGKEIDHLKELSTKFRTAGISVGYVFQKKRKK